MQHFIHKIQALTGDLKVELFHVPRAQNALVDKLAKWSVGQLGGFEGNYMPDC